MPTLVATTVGVKPQPSYPDLMPKITHNCGTLCRVLAAFAALAIQAVVQLA